MANQNKELDQYDEYFDGKSSEESESQALQKKAIETGGKATKEGTKKAAKSLWNRLGQTAREAILKRIAMMIASKYFLLAIASVVIVIILIIVILCALTFLYSAPNMLKGQIVAMLDDMGTAIKSAYVSITQGDDYAQVSKQNVKDVANYIDIMGFDLIGYGFVGFDQKKESETTREQNGKTVKETKYSDGDYIKRVGNDIESVDSNLLTTYIAAENRTYMLSTVSISSLYRWWKGVSIFPKFESTNGEENKETGTAQNSDFGTGMIVIDNTIDKITDYTEKNADGTTKGIAGWSNDDIVAYTEAVKKVAETKPNVTPEVDRAQRKLTLTIKENGKETKAVYNLDGYTGRFGKPIEFLLALHLGTMAPGLAQTVATDVAFDTKVHIRLHKVVEVTRVTYKEKSMDYWQQEWNRRRNEYLNWYKRMNNIAIQNKQSPPYPDYERRAENDANESVGISNKDIQNAIKYQTEHNKVTYVPYISSVDHHWYKDVKFKDLEAALSTDAYVETYPTKKESTYSANSKMSVTTYKSGEIYQVKEPERGQYNENTKKMEDKVNETFEKLFSDKTWNKISGMSGDSKDSNSMTEFVNTKVTLNGDMKNAIVMIQNAAQKSLDAKYVLRDLKEWLTEKHGIKFQDQKILTNKVTTDDDETDDTDSSTNGNSSNNSSTTGSTTSSTTRLKNLLGGKTAPIQYSGNDAIVKTSELPNGTGVNSVVGGKIIEKSDNAVQIQVTSPSSLAGKTLILSGLQMDTAIQKGAEVKTNTPLGETVSGQDMKIKLLNEYKTSISVEDNLK